MLITITTVSILVISAVVWLANRVLPVVVCPICAGVFLTWVGLLGAYHLGYQIILAVPALLMGGSVVGVAYQLEKKIRNVSAGSLLLWKALFIPAGFVTAYSILEQAWIVSSFGVVFLFLVSFVLVSANKTKGSHAETAGTLEKKMEHCC